MPTEDKGSIRQCKIAFHTKDKGILLYLWPSIQLGFPRHGVIHNTERRMFFISADKINQLSLLPCSRFALKHSVTFLIVRSW